MQVVLLLGSVSSLLTLVTGKCPPDKGIYLMHGGYCLPEYTVVSINALPTAADPLHCVLAGSSGTRGGQWTGPDNTPVQCGGSGSGPLTCSQSSDPTNITLYYKTGGTFSGKQLYTCNISGQNISVQIKSNEIDLAIYIEPPADVMSVPQNYTVHCLIDGFTNTMFTLELALENMYYTNPNNPPPVSGYNQYPDHSVLNSEKFIYDYSEEVVWRAGTVVVDGTEFSDRGFTKYNGDHDWACHVNITTRGIDVVQTYIRAPSFAPTNLGIAHKNATSVTISWTAVNASDADGYIVNITLLSSAHTNNPTLVDVGNVTQYTLNGSVSGETYLLTARAYQDLLGPESGSMNITIENITVLFQPLNWSLVSDRTSPVVQYRVYCTAAYVKPDHIIWRMNGTIVVNSSSTTISHQLLDATIDNYTNILTVTGDHRTQTISCEADYSSGLFKNSDTLAIEAPSGPPMDVKVSIYSSSNILVSWKPPVGGADGYVILYSASNVTHLIEQRTLTMSLLNFLNESHLYTIRVFAYKDLPSLPYDAGNIYFAAPGPVSNLDSKPMLSSFDLSLSWTPPNAKGTFVSHYNITYFNITCPSEQQFTDSGSVTVNSPLTSTPIPLQSGQLYNISVRASNAVGVSLAVSGTFWTPVNQAPSASPKMVNINSVRSSSIDVSWGELPCPHRNGEITGYVIMYKQKGERGGGRQMSRQSQVERIMVDGHTVTIDDLDPLTEYSVMVAGVNSAGTGQFSEPVTVVTESESRSANELTPALVGGVGSGVVLIIILLVVMIVVSLLIWRRFRGERQRNSHPTNLTKGMYELDSEKEVYLPLSNKQGMFYEDIDVKVNTNGTARDKQDVCYEDIDVKVNTTGAARDVCYEDVSVKVNTSGTAGDKQVVFYEEVDVKVNTSGTAGDKQDVSYDYIHVKGNETVYSGMTPDYLYASVNKVKEADKDELYSTACKDAHTASYMEIPFDHQIQTTLPIVLSEMCKYVEGCHGDSNNAFHSQFEELQDGDVSLATIGFNKENKMRNRFKNITAYDNNRVVLLPMEGHEHDFVNASYVDGYSSNRKFIATQGPNKKTLVDFWRLVWQERPQCIVMVTNVVEEGKTKCEQYWPSREEGSQTFGPFDVSLLNEVTLPDYTVRTLKVCVKGHQSSVTVTQYHFTSWPDHGVPQYGSPLMMVHKKVKAEWKRGGPPIIVHCSAGVGRTGTYITIDIALEQAEKKGVVDIAGIINRLREQRMLMVQTVQQYIFLHDAILEHVICGQTEVPSDKLPSELAKLRRIDTTTEKNKIQDQFELLAKVTADPDEGIFTSALKNPEKNRMQKYFPNENQRVTLKGEYPGYINASFVNGYREKKTFIIAQCPMENTVRDFWKMVVDYRVPVVVMLCDLNEDKTLYPYWPEENDSLTFGEFYIEMQSTTQCDGFVRRNIKILQKGQKTPFEVIQFQVTMWPPHGVANSPGYVIALMDTVLFICRKRKKGPVVVQCSDTVSRSGMYCAISNALEQCKAEGVVDVFQTVKAVRMQKPGAVTTQEQYNFIFDVVVAFLNSYDNYANFSQL